MTMIFKRHVCREHFNKIPLEPRLEKYVDMCVECSFLVAVQDPPMYLEYPENEQKKNTSLFKPFMKKGKERAANNPNIADLSDRNRPTKLGEKFEQLFDNEWSEAFEYLKGIQVDDDQILKTLVDILQEAYKFCQDFAQQELERLESHIIEVMTYIKWRYEDNDGETQVVRVHRNPEDKSAFLGLHRLMADAMKACATASVPALTEMFKTTGYKEQFSMIRMDPPLENYVDRCVEYSFLMVVQDPPMYLEYPESGQKINTSLFKPFRQKGSIVQMCVWPCVCLHKDGPVVCKGYVLPQ